MIFMVDVCSALQMADVLRAARAPCCRVVCFGMCWVSCIVAAHTVSRVSEIPHFQYTEFEGWKIPLSFSLSLKPVAGSSHHGFSNKATRNDVVHWETSGPGETQKSQGTFITILTPVQNTLASLQSHNQSNSTHKLRIKATLYVLCLRILTWLNKQPLLLGGSIDLSSVDIWTFSVLFYCAQFNFELSFTGRVYCSWFAVSVRVTELCTICTAITNLERTFSWVMSRVVMNKNKYSSMLMRHTFRKAFANIVYGTFQEWEGLKVFIKTAFFLVQQMFSERG